ncbi:MAG TPA: response regulator transcription factor [Terriglobales bacterium]|nr:response regulator transcription factor [Terriglobales bacterium]
MSDAPIRVLVADDQTLVREGLVTLLGLIPGIEVAGVARDGEEAIDLAGRLRPDVVLMDLRMPRLDGVEATRRLAAAGPTPRVVVLTTYADDQSIFAALQAGALGYLTKDSGADDIARAVRTVHAGQALLEPAVQRRLIESLRERPPAPATVPPAPAPDDLTPREVEVLGLIARGLSNGEIARRLFVSEATVKTHVNNIFSKAGVRDRAQAVRYAFDHGLGPRPLAGP